EIVDEDGAQDAKEAPPAPETDDEAVDAEIVEESATEAPSGPDEYEGPDEHLEGRAYSGPQIIAMKFGDQGVSDRAERLAVISDVIGRPIRSSKDLETHETQMMLQAFDAGLDARAYVDELPPGVVDGFRPESAPAETPP